MSMAGPRLTVKHTDGTTRQYGMAVLKVRTRDAKGRPRLLDFCPDDEVIDISVHKEFVTAFLPVSSFDPPGAKGE